MHGVKIYKDQSKRVIGLSRGTYLKNVLERFNTHNSKLISTPAKKNHHLCLKDCLQTAEVLQKMAHAPYSNTIGCLMYAMLCTRPDISFAVKLLSHFQSNPGPSHWSAINRVLRYIRSTTDYVLCYGRSILQLHEYTDVKYARYLDKCKSTSAYTFLLKGVISGYSKSGGN